MKYSSTNKPLVCMQTQSTCYKGTSKMKPLGVLWHSTGVNNPTLKRYVQPSDTKPAADTYSKAKWLEVLGKNTNGNDWNHIKRNAGLNCWIGKLADGTVTTIQTMPWDYQPWGCGSGSKGSCNQRWMQFEICEGDLTDKKYFEAVYKEACEVTAYYCQMYNIDPKGTVTYNGVKVPTILCHQDSYKLKLGSNHSDVYPWFKKHGKTMDDVRNDVAALLNGKSVVVESTTASVKSAKSIIYQTYDDTANKWLPNVTDKEDYAGIFGHPVTGVFANLTAGNCTYKVHTNGGKWLPEVNNRDDYAGILDKPIDGFMIKGDSKIHYQVHIKGGNWLDYVTGYDETDDNNGYAGIFGKTIDAIRMYVEEEKVETPPVTTAPAKKYYRVRLSWLNTKSQKGAYTALDHAIECCQEAGEGYKVFDWSGKVVYEYIAPVKETIKTEATTKPEELPSQEIKPETEVPAAPAPEVEIKPEVVPAPIPEPEVEELPDPTPEADIDEPESSEVESEAEPKEEKPSIDVNIEAEKQASIWSFIKKLLITIVNILKGSNK
jgi:hypothetical protein